MGLWRVTVMEPGSCPLPLLLMGPWINGLNINPKRRSRLKNKEVIMAKTFPSGEYLGEIRGFKVYRMKDGFLEGYKSSNQQNPDDSILIQRVVTTTTTIEEFKVQLARKLRRPRIHKEKPDPAQLKIE
jgi:hypothetical protein